MNLRDLTYDEFDDLLTERVARTLFYSNVGPGKAPALTWERASAQVKQEWRNAAGNAIAVYRLINQERADQDRASYVREVLT